MIEIGKDLLQKKEKIENAKAERQKIEGKIEILKEKLKKDFNCVNIEEGKELINKLKQDTEKQEKELTERMVKLNEYFTAV